VVFTRQDGRKRRRRMVAADNLDVDARILVDALRNTHASWRRLVRSIPASPFRMMMASPRHSAASIQSSSPRAGE